MVATLVACLGVLFFFKYYNWLASDLVAFLSSLSIPCSLPMLAIMLPVGISFYTFQTLSYVIDVYKGQLEPETHFGYYATYIAFFPQLVAGPIERASNILPQLRDERCFNRALATRGAQRMAWGFFKKIVVADTMAKGVEAVYGNVGGYSGFVLVIATVMFAIQIYCDFSGYSDIAIGTAQLLGINLMTNFDRPYYSASIKEFWSRWHISLSTWFRDYVYIPLGGNRCSTLRRDFNLAVTFLVSGLWHGANWTFVIWGGLHGAAQIVENHIYKHFPALKKDSRTIRAVKTTLTFTFVCFAWVFFRAQSADDALYVVTHAFAGVEHLRSYFLAVQTYSAASGPGVAVMVFEVALLAVVDWLCLKKPVNDMLADASPIIRYPIYVAFMILIAFLASKGAPAEFIYFQF